MSIDVNNAAPHQAQLMAMPAGVPAPTMYALQPVSGPAGSESQASAVRIQSILAALRRRWFVALVLGVIFASAAAAGAWYSIPDTYTAFAELRLNSDSQFVFSNRETRLQEAPLEFQKQTYMKLISDPSVLVPALRDESVHNCQTLRDVEDDEEWLAQHIRTSSSGLEFIKVSLEGQRPHDLSTIVNAVVDSFLKVVVDEEFNEEKRNLDKLLAQIRDQKLEVDRERKILQNLDRKLQGTSNDHATTHLEKLTGSTLELERQLGVLRLQMLQTKVRIAMLEATEKARNESSETASEDALEDQAADDHIETKELATQGIPLFLDFEIDEPELQEIVEGKLATDSEYGDMRVDFEKAKADLAFSKKRYQPGHSKIIEADAKLVELQAALDTYVSDRRADIREQLKAELQEQFAPPVEEPSPGDEEIAAETDQPEKLPNARQQENPLLIAKAELQAQVLEREEILRELEKSEVKTGDFTNLLVERDDQANEVQLLESRTRRLEDTAYTREVELNHRAANPKVRKQRDATPPTTPDRGKRIKLAGVAGMGAFGLVAAIIVFFEYSAHRLSSVDEVQQSLNLQVMSTIPIMPRWADAHDDPNQNQRSAYWHSVLTESVDSTRTLLLRQAQLNSTKVVMIASAMGGEGKTTLSCHLATSLARAGRKVLLVDGDVRRPSLHAIYDVANTPGLCELLTETASAELPDIIHPLEPAGLDVLTAGRVSSEALRELAQDKLEQVVDVAKQKYDFVILDSSPILPVTDALLMSQYVDAVLFSIRRDVSRTNKVASAVQRLAMLGVNVLGAVAIGLNEGPMTAGYTHSYYHGYAPGPMNSGINGNGHS